MSKTLLPAALLAALASCQTATAPTTPAAPPTPTLGTTMPPPANALTAEAARAAVGRHLQGQPNAALYVLDSASVVDADTHWQVLVPRTDWAKRMPNKAAFEEEKRPGTASILPVK